MLTSLGCFVQDDSLPGPQDPKETVTGYDAAIEIRVLVCNPENDPQCLDAYPGPGASIVLFKTEEDREYGEPVYRSGITAGENGSVTFSGLEGGKRYYISTIYSGAQKLSSETVPLNGIARHDVIFPE